MKIYIAEDEPLAAAKLKLFLEKLGEGPDISHFDNGINVLAAIQQTPPDVLFLDIQMPGMTGMEVLERLTDSHTQFIITSAYDQYALPAFKYNVADYLLKPYTIERLKASLDKVKNTLRLLDLDQQMNAATITIRCEGRTETLHQCEIISLESLRDYVRIQLKNGQRRMVLAPLSSFESQLGDDFVRVHRSYIINRKEVVASNGNEVSMSDGQTISVGKTYKNILK